VIPRDVKQWKGEEFFHKLIAQARQNRQGIMSQAGSAQGEMKPPLPNMHKPTFVSTHMGGGVI